MIRSKILIPCLVAICFMSLPAAGGLISGVLVALILDNPYLEKMRKITPRMLAISVVGLGAGTNLGVVARVGLQGFAYTLTGILFAMGVGLLLGKFFKTEKDLSILLSTGTAICGGSAIAAMAPTIRARSHETSVALGIVFLLNAVALLLFPWLGHLLGMSEAQFGLWSALAIHDTSSVVGATSQYGPQALEIGTTVKLARALWIVPLTWIVGYFVSKAQGVSGSSAPVKRPWFILGFVLMAAVVTWVPALTQFGHQIEWGARRLLVVTLFFIGCGLNRNAILSVGLKPFAQGVSLWVLVAAFSLFVARTGFFSF